MSPYSYVPLIDGVEKPALVLEQRTDQEATLIGRSMLLLAMNLREPEAASISVYAGASADGHALGVWEWTKDQPEPTWRKDG